MAELITADTGSQAYISLIKALLYGGDMVSPRGQLTVEVPDVTVVVKNLADAHVFNTQRRLNLKILATEYMHLLGGLSSLEQLDLASGGRFTQFANEGRLMGAYGPRIRHQLPRVVDLLRRDPDTRQAVLTIWNGQEHAALSRDVPCTLAVKFRIRNDALDVHTIMRSNDVVLGVPYDWWMMSRLGLSVASVLGVEPGQYVHTVDSMHLYECDLWVANDVEEGGVLSKPRVAVPPALTPASRDDKASSIEVLSSVAEDICLGRDTDELGFDYVGADWYLAHVPRLNGHVKCRKCHCVFAVEDMYPGDTDFCKVCG